MWGGPQLSGGVPPPATGMLLLRQMAAEQQRQAPSLAAPVRSCGTADLLRSPSPVRSAGAPTPLTNRRHVHAAGGRRPRPVTPKRPGTSHPPAADDDLYDGEMMLAAEERGRLRSRREFRSRLTLDFSKLVSRETRSRPLRHRGRELTKDLDYQAGVAKDTTSARARGFSMAAQTSRNQRAASLKGRWAEHEAEADVAPPTPASAPARFGGGVTMERTTSRETRTGCGLRNTREDNDLPWRDGYAPQPHTPVLLFESQTARRIHAPPLEPGQEQFYDGGADRTFADSTRHVLGAVQFGRSTSREVPVSCRHGGSEIGGIDFGTRSTSAAASARGLRRCRTVDLSSCTGRHQRAPTREGSRGTDTGLMTVLKVRYGSVDRATKSPIPFRLQSTRDQGTVSVTEGGTRRAPRSNLPAYDTDPGHSLVRKRLDRGHVRFAVQSGRGASRGVQAAAADAADDAAAADAADAGDARRRRRRQLMQAMKQGPHWSRILRGFDLTKQRQRMGHVSFAAQTPRHDVDCGGTRDRSRHRNPPRQVVPVVVALSGHGP
eukprot:TRINITY_DN39266_c0_g1_i1.p1 TRINITY_DN39266_c0_g1~~TRINITY_DN39266_c0_g1_i1.p1  ORF type:complete len:548 (+),score=159.18 TRINITY_DN39266_c0_g1_i1:61-1704(+)